MDRDPDHVDPAGLGLRVDCCTYDLDWGNPEKIQIKKFLKLLDK